MLTTTNAVREVYQASRDERQDVALHWVMRTFGMRMIALPERGARFLEESIELAQAMSVPRDVALRMVDYVYDRPAGDIAQEVGGVGVTLLALCAAVGVSADMEEASELQRVLAQSREYFVERQQVKHDAGLSGAVQ